MDEEKEDRISLLPDCLLLEIISRIKIMDKRKEEERLMSTKEVINTTTILSKRWQHLWTLLPTLVFIFKEDVTYPWYDSRLTNYFSFIDKTLTQCPNDVNLKKFTLQISDGREHTKQVNSLLRYAIRRKVQEIDLRITAMCGNQSCDDELFFNNSCLISMKLSRCTFNPPIGAIRFDTLKYLCIDQGGINEDSILKILSGSPCLETLELNDCYLVGRIPKSLFGNFGVLESLSCDFETYESFSIDYELFLNDLYGVSMKLSRSVFNPPTGTIGCDKLKFLCIKRKELYEHLIGDILSGSPFLETLQLNDCCGFGRLDVTSMSIKNLVLSGYDCPYTSEYHIDTLEINAPYILSLTIKGDMYLIELVLENVSSLVKADLNYQGSYQFAKEIGRDEDEIEEELLRGILSSLGHVNDCTW